MRDRKTIATHYLPQMFETEKKKLWDLLIDSAIDSLYPPTQSLNPWQLIRALTATNPLCLRHSTHYSQPRIVSSSPVKMMVRFG